MNYKKYLLGTNEDNERIYLTPLSWDCGWYWGFGCIGNKNMHYHLSSLYDKTNLYDGIKKHFGDTFLLKNDSDIWKFSELIRTFYILKDTCEVLGRGGSHYTTNPNPCSDLIKNTKEVERINKIVLPAIFAEIYKILDNPKK